MICVSEIIAKCIYRGRKAAYADFLPRCLCRMRSGMEVNMIGIRADANEEIASGHIMRCMAIAAQLVRIGIDVKFYISDDYSVQLLESRGFKYYVLKNDWRDKSREIQDLADVLERDKVTLLLVDSYEIDSEYFRALHQYVKLAYIDDLCRFACDVDVLINYAVQNCHEIYNDFRWGKMPRMLTGLSYTPLREEFAAMNEASKRCIAGIDTKTGSTDTDAAYSDCADAFSAQQVTDIMITTGGSDNFGLTAEVAREILALYGTSSESSADNGGGFKTRIENSVKSAKQAGVRLHILEGAFFNEDIKFNLMNLEKEYRSNVIVHRNLQHIENVLKDCQLVVSAGGTTLLEICACRKCCVCFAISANQKPLTEYLAGQKAVRAVYAPQKDVQKLAKTAAQAAYMLAGDCNERRGLAAAAGNVVDGKGAERIAKVLNELLYDKIMSVSTTNGDIICKSKAEMVEIIKNGAALPNGDEIWVSSNEKAYPCLSILIKGKYACLHYFKNDQGDVWQSRGDFNKEVTFLEGDREWTAPEYVIVSLEKAINCMEEFWDTLKRPKGIEWEALCEEG